MPEILLNDSAFTAKETYRLMYIISMNVCVDVCVGNKLNIALLCISCYFASFSPW